VLSDEAVVTSLRYPSKSPMLDCPKAAVGANSNAVSVRPWRQILSRKLVFMGRLVQSGNTGMTGRTKSTVATAAFKTSRTPGKVDPSSVS